MSSPEPTDTGLEWKGWHRSASESLMHATVDPDPRCVVRFTREALDAAHEALAVLKNPRQLAVSTALIEAAVAVQELAERTPEQM